jgi:hypothetical protein
MQLQLVPFQTEFRGQLMHVPLYMNWLEAAQMQDKLAGFHIIPFE